MSRNKTQYYSSFEEDFFQADKKYTLEKDYEYIKASLPHKIWASLLYGIALIFSNIYCRLFLHVRFVGAKKVRNHKGGMFIYGNHTQPIGDVFNPALACFPKRIYTVVSPANLNLPVIGKLLRPLGALPLPDTISGMKSFNKAIMTRVKDSHPIIIYPEAHLWEYYTKIRPFGEAAFYYPIKADMPVFCMTTTYQKRKLGKKPKITVFVDGPFIPCGNTTSEKASFLRDCVFNKMQERSKESNCEYIKYIKK